MTKTQRPVIVALAFGALALGPTQSTIALTVSEVAPGSPHAAVYGGGTLDLSESWSTARACVERSVLTECYDTERDLLAAHPEFVTTPAKGAVGVARTLLADCSSSLRLYDGTVFTGTVLYLTTRQVVLNLAAYGFDNRTSSYKVGACGTTFYSAANAGGSSFSGGAFTQAASMLVGWNNIVSSVYIA